MKTCSGCNTLVVDFVQFKCPKCREEVVIRCASCRKSANSYTMECGFVGP